LQLICTAFIFNFQCRSGALVVHKIAYCSRKWKKERLLEKTAHLCWLKPNKYKHTILISSISFPSLPCRAGQGWQ
jgi:hypothetical protein